MRYTIRPLSDRSPFTGQHEPNPFRATWPATLDLLGRELDAIDARHVVLEVDVTEGEIRQDGMLYARAKVATPGVRIAFDSRYGPLTYATDRYQGRWMSDPPDWQINVRAIALGLEALRRVDRYGITRRGEQYAGWKQLPAGSGNGASHMTRDEALDVLNRVTGRAVAPGESDGLVRLHRLARAETHPDRHGGDRALWDQVEQAAAVLGVGR